jgi:hypothetical protein
MQQASSWITPPSFAEAVTGFHPTKTVEILVIVTLLTFCLGWLFLTWKLYYVFGWTTYKEMGADVEVRSKIFLTKDVLYLYHIYILLLKVDVFFFLGFSLQFAWLVLQAAADTVTPATGISPFQLHLFISIPGTLVMLLFAYFAVYFTLTTGSKGEQNFSLCCIGSICCWSCIFDFQIVRYMDRLQER